MFGVYIHFPFCRKRCPFCDFVVAVRPEIPHERYERAVVEELAVRAPLYQGRRAVSFYFGGGTPGLWRADCIGRLVEALTGRFGSAREVTVECIPGELTPEHAQALARAGVTRLSIGIESLDDRRLAHLGRAHSAADGEHAVEAARSAGFSELSADLMFALPGQSSADFLEELLRLERLGLPHLSLYQLTIEPGTAFARSGVKATDSEQHFLAAHDHLTEAGYLHYEVSSYGRPGHEAVHNRLYWRGGEYLGLGIGAHSFRRLPQGGGERFSVMRELDQYLQAPAVPPAEHETLSPEVLWREATWLWLRMIRDGLPRAEFARCYGVDPAVEEAQRFDELAAQGLVEVTPETIRPTRRGMLMLDEIALRIV